MAEAQFIPEAIVTGWEQSVLSPEVSTAEGRRNVVLNMAQNGAQTLTILAMEPNSGYWESWFEISKRTKELAGQQLTHETTTKGHLLAGIGPIGAARSTPDNLSWAITPFGIEMRPALIYIWEQFIDMDVNPSSLLATKSARKDSPPGMTPALARENILMAALNNPAEIRGITQSTGLSDAAIRRHADILAEAGFIDRIKGVHGLIGEPVTFRVTDLGEETVDWRQTSKHSRSSNLGYAQLIQKAAGALKEKGLIISFGNIMDVLGETEDKEMLTNSRNGISNTLYKLINKGILVPENKRTDFQIALTPLGLDVVRRIFLPLRGWSYNPKSVEEINNIAQNLTQNPLIYAKLYREIGQVFKETSVYASGDPEKKARDVYAEILENSDGLTLTKLARKLRISNQSVRRALTYLQEAGRVRGIEDHAKKVVKYIPLVKKQGE